MDQNQFNELMKNMLGEMDLTDEERAINAATEAHKKLSANITNTNKALTGFFGSLTSQDAVFKKVNDTFADTVGAVSKLAEKIPVFGVVISALGQAASEAMKLMTAETSKAWGTFTKLSGSGLVASFQDMRDNARDTGMMFEQISGAIEKHSSNLAGLGDTALNSAKSMSNIFRENSKLNKGMMRLGIGFEEFAEYQTSYVQRAIQQGNARGKTEKQLAEGAAEYVEQLDAMSKLTGIQRSELQKNMDALMADRRYRMAMNRLGEKQQGNLERSMTLITTKFPTALEALKSAIGSGGQAINKESGEFATYIGQAGIDADKFLTELAEGRLSETEVYDFMIKIAPKLEEAYKDIGGLPVDLMRFHGDILKLSAEAKQRGKKTIADSNKEVKAIIDGQKNASDAVADSMTSAQAVATQMQQLMTSSSAFLTVTKDLTGALGSLLEATNKLVQSMADGNKNVPGSTADTTSGGGKRPTVALSAPQVGNIKDYIKANEGFRDTAYTDTTGNLTIGYGHKILPGEDMFKTGKHSKEDLDYLFDMDFQKHLTAAKAIPGFGNLSESGQQALIDMTFNMGPGWHKKWPGLINGLLNKDINAVVESMSNSKWASQVGDRATKNIALMKSAKFLAMGGVIQPSPGGTFANIAEAGKAEAVVPLPDGRSIPVTFTGFDEQKSIMAGISTRLDSLISLFEINNRHQNNLVSVLS